MTNEPEPPTPRSTRRTPILLAVLAVAVIAVGAAIGIAVASDDTTPLLAGAPSSTTAGSPVTSGGQSEPTKTKGKKGAPTLGTITQESGSTWTITTAQGSKVQVTITAQTKFGTKKAPADRSAFAVGRMVAVVAAPGGSGSSITAARIRAANGANKTPTPAPSSARS